MKKHLALLRGINVAGQKIIRMADLRNTFDALGFALVKTYLQSGNVIFSSEIIKSSIISELIRRKITEQFGFDVEVLVLSCQQICEAADSNPFQPDPGKISKFLHVTIPSHPVSESHFQQLNLPLQAGEEATVAKDVIYLFCPNGYGRTKINNAYFEKAFGFPTTTRNWKTILALADLCRA